jgi:chemotaxis-related protein WspD
MMHSSCWREIGISGDRSCPELKHLIHCRNCSVYTRTARQVFDRPLPETVQSESRWESEVIPKDVRKDVRKDIDRSRMQGDRDDEMGRNAVAIFRLNQEWFALPALMFQSIVPWVAARPIPYRSNDVLEGLVNVRGELLMCISLSRFLNLPPHPIPSAQSAQHRLAIIEYEGDRWTFSVDEFQGIETIPPPTLLPPPSTVLKSTQTYTHSLLPWSDQRTINCLDESLLFEALTRKALP